jgi:hypothetical protein
MHVPEFIGAHGAYKTLTGRASRAVALLYLILLVSLATTLNFLFQLYLLQGASQGRPISEADANLSELCSGALALANLGARLVAAVFFCIWGYRAYANLDALGAEGLNYTPGWATWGFFIPFLNLVRPYQVYAEVWKASDPEHPVWNPRVGLAQSTPIVNAWWACWLLSIVLTAVAGALTRDSNAQAIATLIQATWILIAGSALATVASFLAIKVVRGITARQEAKFALVSEPSKDQPTAGFKHDW